MLSHRSPRMLLFCVCAAAFALVPSPTSAHHSFAAEFDIDQPVTLRGTLTKMEWLNPHGWIYLDVKGDDGKLVNWAIETGGVTAMQRRGLRPANFTIGAEIIVKGYRARSGKAIANGAKVTFADGRDFTLGEITQ